MKETRSIRKHRLVALAAMTILSIAGAGQALAQQRTPVRAAYVPVISWLPVWIAKDRGIFEKNGLDVTLTPIQNLSLLPPTMGKQFDFAPSTPPDLIKAAASGLDVVTVAGEVVESTGRQNMQVIVRKDSGITGPKDLKGKVVATSTIGAIMHVATLHWIKAAGADPNAIRAVEVPFPNMADQLKAGRADAVEALQPFVGQMLASGYVSIGNPLLSVADPVLLSFWIAQGSWARANMPTVEKWIASLEDSKKFMEESPQEARAILAKYTNLPEAVAQKIPFPQFEFRIQPAQLDIWVKTMKGLNQPNTNVDPAKLVVTK